MGNPRVTAWKEGKSIWSLISLGPSQVLEVNKKLCILLPQSYISIDGCVFFTWEYSKPVCAALCLHGHMTGVMLILVRNLAQRWITWEYRARLKYTKPVPTHEPVKSEKLTWRSNEEKIRNQESFMCLWRARCYFQSRIWEDVTQVLQPLDSWFNWPHAPAPLVRIQFRFLAYVEKTGQALGLDAL